MRQKSEFYTTTSNSHLSGWMEKKLQITSQSQTCTKKGHSHCLGVCCPSDPVQLSEFWWKQYIWEAYSVNRDAPKTPMPAAGIGQQSGPNSSLRQRPHSQHFKGWTNWATKFCLIRHIHLTSHQLTTTSSSISTTFCRENASTTASMHKVLSKSLSNPEEWFSPYKNEQTYFSFGKSVLPEMVPILINKDVFEPSYKI